MSAESVAPVPQEPAARVENVGRGTLFALAVIPVGVALWVLLWSLGFIASLVAALVAFLAVVLYARGAGSLSRVGAVIVVAITVLTLLLAFFGGIVLDAAQALGELSGLGAWGAFVHEEFWPTFWEIFPEAAPEYLPDFGWAIGFGALGSFATLRSVLGGTAPAQVDDVTQVDDATALESEATPDASASPDSV